MNLLEKYLDKIMMWLEAGVIVKDQIDCSSCIMTIDTAKKIKESEIYRGE